MIVANMPRCNVMKIIKHYKNNKYNHAKNIFNDSSLKSNHFHSTRTIHNNKLIACFTGQGSQFPGMASELYQTDQTAKYMIDEADEALGYKLSDIMFDTSSTTTSLTLTSNAQPAILLYSIIMLEKYMKNKLNCKHVKDAGYHIALGHSLGEYTALVATGSISLKDGVKLVHKRGMAMQKAVTVSNDNDNQQYGMYALMPTTYENALELCETINNSNTNDTMIVSNVANHNAKQQVVISGHIDAMEQVISLGKEKKYIRRATKLDVSAPFHSYYMKPAVIELKDVLDEIEFHDPMIPIVSNVSGEIYDTSDGIKENLLEQLCGKFFHLHVHIYTYIYFFLDKIVFWTNNNEMCIHMYAGTVQWCKSMDTVDDYHDNDMEMTWHEFGPKPILSALIKKHFVAGKLIECESFCV